MKQNFDFIIVGAGSAGCVLADRLSASDQYSVLLIEAGGEDNSFWLKIPIGFAKSYYNPTVNWMYNSQAEQHLAGRSVYCPRGKVLGGSGAINAMIYVRGHPSDFDDWAAATGDEGWSYEQVLPYFKRMESHENGETALRGGSGPIHVTPMEQRVHPVCQDFLAASAEVGEPITKDFNGAQMDGAGIYEINTRHGQRCSSGVAYLKPARARNNVTVLTRSVVHRLIFDKNQNVAGVLVLDEKQNTLVTYYANKEVILSAGAVGTPKIMELSGLGNAAVLEQHQLPVVKHLPAVGKHLQDHLCTSYYYSSNVKTLNDDFTNVAKQAVFGLQYLLHRKGPFSLSVNQAGGFFKGTPNLPRANLQVYFNPLSYQIPKDGKNTIKPEPYSGFLMCFNSTRPSSRGSVHIRSAQIEDAPNIAPNYLSSEQDVAEVIQGSLLLRNLARTQALSRIIKKEVLPGERVHTEDEMLEYFRHNSGSIYHLCGSCAMGRDAQTSVVNSRLQVHGVAGLRIVDASIFPNITSGNINAPTMMVAEKAADMILDDAK